MIKGTDIKLLTFPVIDADGVICFHVNSIEKYDIQKKQHRELQKKEIIVLKNNDEGSDISSMYLSLQLEIFNIKKARDSYIIYCTIIKDTYGNPIRVYKIKDELLSIDENCKCYYRDNNPFPNDEVANKQFMVLIDFEFNIKFYPDGIRWRLYDLKRYLQDIMERNLDLRVEI